MRDEGQAVLHGAFDTSDVAGSDREVPERDWAPPRIWPSGTQPMAAAWDDDDVQVMLDSNAWHRQAAGLPETACGLKIDYRYTVGVRASSYLGRLCDRGCFSPHELTEIAPRLTEQYEREQTARIDKICEDAHQAMLDGEERRRKKKDK
jgi:hypothetical protein